MSYSEGFADQLPRNQPVTFQVTRYSLALPVGVLKLSNASIQDTSQETGSTVNGLKYLWKSTKADMTLI